MFLLLTLIVVVTAMMNEADGHRSGEVVYFFFFSDLSFLVIFLWDDVLATNSETVGTKTSSFS